MSRMLVTTMGLAKQHQIEVEERGYDYIGDAFACDECLSDSDLKAFVIERATTLTCSYCGRKEETPIAMPIDDLLDEIADAVGLSYRPLSPDDFFEGDLFISTHSTDELLEFEIGGPFDNDALRQAITDAFVVDEWCKQSPLNLTEGEALIAGWESFSEQVRYVTRYLFFDEPSSWEDSADPREILQRIHNMVDTYGLTKPLQRDTWLYRARYSTNLSTVFKDASALGAPTAEQAVTSSRMSPAGIPVFYGGLDLPTALAETLAHAGPGSVSARVRVSWGKFRTLDYLLLLDLMSPPEMPGLFSPDRANRQSLMFLQAFAREVSKPIPADGREHIEYAPTQVVSEYFRHVYRTADGQRVNGVLYPSSVHPGGTSCVLFIGAQQCCDLEDWSGEDEPYKLGLDGGTVGSGVYEARWEKADA